VEATNHEPEAFSYSVSHDLRTPFRHVAGFARILVNDFGPVMAVEERAHLQRIEDAVSRMGLLAVLRRQSLRLGRSELNPIVNEAIIKESAAPHGQEISPSEEQQQSRSGRPGLANVSDAPPVLSDRLG
jgi:light-regulated signal transduction histidine kinase (bacteriophytochrome)